MKNVLAFSSVDKWTDVLAYQSLFTSWVIFMLVKLFYVDKLERKLLSLKSKIDKLIAAI